MEYNKKLTDYWYYRVDPLPTEEELAQYYKDIYFQDLKSPWYQKEYSADEIRYFRNIVSIAHHIVEREQKKKGWTLLDVWSWEWFLSAFFEEKWWDVALCDFWSYGLELQNKHLLDKLEQWNIFEILKQKSEAKVTYDYVNLMNVLEHVLDPEELLERLHALMHKDSILWIKIPNDYSDFQKALLKDGHIDNDFWFCPLDHLNYFTFESLKTLAEDKWFEVVSMLADYPVDQFLTNEFSNYKRKPETGKAAHASRVYTENFLIEKSLPDYVNAMEAMAKLWYGRSIHCFLRVK